MIAESPISSPVCGTPKADTPLLNQKSHRSIVPMYLSNKGLLDINVLDDNYETKDAAFCSSDEKRPILNLEILTVNGMKGILLIMYSLAIFSFLFSVWELQLRLREEIVKNNSVDFPIAELNATNAQKWHHSTIVSRINLDFTLSAKIEDATDDMNCSGTFPILQNIDVFEANDHSIMLSNLSVPTNITVNCKSHCSECSLATFFSQDPFKFVSFQSDLLFSISSSLFEEYFFNISIVYLEGDPFPLSTTYTFAVQKKAFRIAEIVLRLFFSAITFAILCYWIHQLHKHWKNCVSEQNWIVVLLVSIFFYQDFLIVPALFDGSRVTNFVAGIMWTTGWILFPLYWCLMLKGIRSTKEIGSLLKFDWSFYRWIILFFVLAWLVIMAPIFKYEVLDDVNADVDKTTIDAWAFRGLSFLIVVVMWVYIVVNSWRAKKYLKKAPYLKTRFRQLSFRLFLWITWLILAYYALSYLLQFVIWQGYLEMGPRNYAISPMILFSVYAYIMVFIYLPVSGQSFEIMGASHVALEQHGFRLQTARWLCDFAWQAYYDDPALPQKAKHGTIDVAKYQFQVLIIESGYHDVHWFVAKSGKRIVISFRGTASFENVKVDIKANRITIPQKVFQNTSADEEWSIIGDLAVSPGQSVTMQNEEKNEEPTTPQPRSKETDNILLPSDGLLESIPLSREESFVSSIMNTKPMKVHAGFWSAYSRLHNKLFEGLEEIVADMEANGIPASELKFYCTGHSLGGALALFCGIELAVKDYDTKVYTFGAPRIGNRRFSDFCEEGLAFNYRIVFSEDPVSHMPTDIGGKYKHAGYEILIDEIGNSILNLNMLEKFILGSRRTVAHHALETYMDGLEAACQRAALEKHLETVPHDKHASYVAQIRERFGSIFL